MKQQNQQFNIQTSTQTSMLLASQSMLITPSKIGLLKRYGEDDILDIKNMRYGDKYAKMLSEGLKGNDRIKDIHHYNLSGNKISQKGADNLLPLISQNAEIIDISNNCIGNLGIDHLSNGLKSRECRVQYLNIENNLIGDKGIQNLLIALESNSSLKYLNLSKNYISDKCGQNLSSFINSAPSLNELYLHWNLLTGNSGIKIFQSLLENDYIKILDLSCNSLGMKANCSQQIAEFLDKNQSMVHLDLSINKFDLEQSKNIANGLEKNKTMYGFHFRGNYGYVDNKMFLVINEVQNNKDLSEFILNSRIDGVKPIVHSNFRNYQRDFELADCCWICQGWQEHEFIWDQEKSGKNLKDPVFIHFNFSDYRAIYLGKQQDNQTYNRVLPPGNNYYFYSQGEDEEYLIAQDHEIIQNPEGNILKDIGIFDKSFKDVEFEKLNFIKVIKNTEVIDSKWYKPNIKTKPRTRDPIYTPAKKLKKRNKWTFPISLMYKWRPDNDDLVKKCFEFDWKYSRIPRICEKKPEDLEAIKQFLCSKYSYIKGTYKYFASINPAQDIWGIQNQPFWDFIKAINFIDNDQITQEGITLKQVAVQANSIKSNPRDFQNAIMRYQFMELLVRLANEKYIDKYKQTTSIFEALKKLWDEHLEPVIGPGNNIYMDKQQKWRNERYWNEDCDYCLKNYKKIIDHVYSRFSKKKVKPGQPPFMCLDELTTIINMAELPLQESFGSEFGNFAFNLSMMTQIDELESNKIFEMNLVEYYEALARLAEKANFPPHPTLQEEINDFDWPYEKRNQQKLGWKLEGLILRLLENCCDPNFKYTYPKITKSFFCKPDDDDQYEN
ncbi:hypothetical protein PPERSA_06838 [Pseudocohnilembus persalinus]|uniref:Uncharacterized protein n=1 Tax=Pseudocohnilembus persalinus TaxID=266149 RepID=A0A0V0QSK3_PSEPJ|nr:hypothetical protein PPERSA_06838 [Pseudocohnilembus persalinus]|eukprot:KRX05204.1 hypothetical protein PPERSA_06838 [Pseudocohnilembus persalinus]